MKGGFLGPKGTYSEEAAGKYSPNADLVPYDHFRSILEAITSGEISFGVIPAKNFYTDDIRGVFHTLLQYIGDANINDAIMMNIRHALGTKKRNKKIERILSKQEALEQCGPFLHEHYPGVEQIEVSSTAEAMKMISEGQVENAAAIGRRESLKRYGLNVIKRDLVPNNQTMFYVIGRETPKYIGGSITHVVLYPKKDTPGVLHSLIKPFAYRKINLHSINSTRDWMGRPLFYAKVKRHCLAKSFKESISEIKKMKAEVSVLGSHPDLSFRI